jgi:hypothetical protein
MLALEASASDQYPRAFSLVLDFEVDAVMVTIQMSHK